MWEMGTALALIFRSTIQSAVQKAAGNTQEETCVYCFPTAFSAFSHLILFFVSHTLGKHKKKQKANSVRCHSAQLFSVITWAGYIHKVKCAGRIKPLRLSTVAKRINFPHRAGGLCGTQYLNIRGERRALRKLLANRALPLAHSFIILRRSAAEEE
jgi:hypothetical protein